MTGRENLVLQGRVYGMRGAAMRSRAQELLERFGLEEAGDRTVRTYSGGMQRKLDVAIGLMHRPQVLFLDEPTTGLDPEARVDMWHEIARLAGDEGLTILMTTHYLEEADGLAQRLAIVDQGIVVAEGTPDELKGELRGDAIAVELRGPAARRRGPPRRRQGARALRRRRGGPRAARAGRQRRPRRPGRARGAGVARASRSPR